MSAPERTLDLRELRREAGEGRGSSIWLGMVLFLLIEGTVIGSLLTSYYYFRVMAAAGWPPPGVDPPELLGPGVSLAILVSTLVPLLVAQRAYRRGRTRPFVVGMAIGCALLGGYLTLALVDLLKSPYGWTEHAYTSLIWTISGYQLLHGCILLLVAAGVLLLGSGFVSFGKGSREGASPLPRKGALSVLTLYWWFVVLVSLPTYFTIYWVPRL